MVQRLILLVLFIALSGTAMAATEPMRAQLAHVYNRATANDIGDYLVSEKYDGIRAIWTGQRLVTRQNNVIHAPAWFTAPLPDVWLDGELWTQRQDFENVSAAVRTQTPDDMRWQQVTYMVFDQPDSRLPFATRYANYQALVQSLGVSHVQAVEQRQFSSSQALDQHLNAMVKQGAEGLMLHLASAPHVVGRTHALLKLKPYFDAEATVIAHLPGRGKYTGMLGALRVTNAQGVTFSIGTGFSDAERANPPPIGSLVTYQYHGYTRNGVPRFASYQRIRHIE